MVGHNAFLNGKAAAAAALLLDVWGLRTEDRFEDAAPSGTSSRAGEDIMAELQMTLTSDERDFLQSLLEMMLKETRVEEHRTRTLSYREHVLHKEQLIDSLLHKLKQGAK
jgi:hypothetical protein